MAVPPARWESIVFRLPAPLAAVAATAALVLATPAAALPIVDGDFSGLSGTETIVDFDEIALAPFQQVTSEFAALGVSFSPNVWFEETRSFANFDGASLLWRARARLLAGRVRLDPGQRNGSRHPRRVPLRERGAAGDSPSTSARLLPGLFGLTLFGRRRPS